MTYDIGNPALDCSNCATLQAEVERYRNILVNIQDLLADESEMTDIMLCTLRAYVDGKVKEFNKCP